MSLFGHYVCCGVHDLDVVKAGDKCNVITTNYHNAPYRGGGERIEIRNLDV